MSKLRWTGAWRKLSLDEQTDMGADAIRNALWFVIWLAIGAAAAKSFEYFCNDRLQW